MMMMSRRGSTGNFNSAYAPLDMYGSGSNHSSIKSDDTTNASSSSSHNHNHHNHNHHNTAAEAEAAEPSFIRAIRRGSMSKEESQRKLQEQLTMVQDYEEQ
jgi:hypothetical protein